MTSSSDESKQITIEFYSADCPICEDATEIAKDAVQSCGCTVRVRPWEEGPQHVRYSEGGAYPVPSIAVGGRVVCDGVPLPDDAQALRRSLRTNEGLRRGRRVVFTYDGEPIEAYEGETVAAALLALEQRTLRRTSRRGEPRGVFCGMGVCFDCLMQIDGRPNVQACVTPVREGMRVETQQGNGTWNGQMPEEVR